MISESVSNKVFWGHEPNGAQICFVVEIGGGQCAATWNARIPKFRLRSSLHLVRRNFCNSIFRALVVLKETLRQTAQLKMYGETFRVRFRDCDH